MTQNNRDLAELPNTLATDLIRVFRGGIEYLAPLTRVLEDALSEATAAFAPLSDTGYNAGTKTTGTFTPDSANGKMQYYINGGAHTLAPPVDGAIKMSMVVTNNASAGAVTLSGFTLVTGTMETTDALVYLLEITVLNAKKHLRITALQ